MSPIIGIILMVAVTVALVSAGSVFFFNLSGNTDSSFSTASVSVTETKDGGKTVRVLRMADSDAVVVGGTRLTEPGDSHTVAKPEAVVKTESKTGSQSVLRIVETSVSQSPPRQSSTVQRRNCAEIYNSGERSSGVYKIYPDGNTEIQVRCEMDKNGGGWTKLNFLSKAAFGQKGAGFESKSSGDSDFGGPNNITTRTLGLVNGPHDSRTSDGAFFQRRSNHRCEVFAAGDANTDSFNGATTGWDYYDAKGNPIPPGLVDSLSKTTSNGTYYKGKMRVVDIDGPFPKGGDGAGGTNSFSIPVNRSASHKPTGGGPLTLWFSTKPDMDAGTTHVIGSDYESTRSANVVSVDFRPVNTNGVPMFFSGKVDKNHNLFSTFNNGCERQAGSELELENPYFYAK